MMIIIIIDRRQQTHPTIVAGLFSAMNGRHSNTFAFISSLSNQAKVELKLGGRQLASSTEGSNESSCFLWVVEKKCVHTCGQVCFFRVTP
jgi:hypothetical protein